jgi:small subunit ribosomal protein S6
MRTYELMFVIDPRVSDEEAVTMTHDYRQMIVGGGSEITKEENWGRRKLAYPIEKLTEGRYFVFYISSEGGKTALPEVEHRMRQNDKILRYLTVRTDLDLKRAGSRVAPLEAPVQPGAAPAAPAGPAPSAAIAPGAAPAAPQPDAAGAGREA